MRKLLYAIRNKKFISERMNAHMFMKKTKSNKQSNEKGTYAMFKNIKTQFSQKLHRCKKTLFLIKHATNSITNPKNFQRITSIYQTLSSYFFDPRYRQYLNTIHTIITIYRTLKTIYDIIIFILSHFF